jgi:hypothetical protein
MIVIFMIKILPLFLPIKYANLQLPKNMGEYIVVRGIKTTGYEWEVTGDQNGLYAERSHNIKCVNMIGNVPSCKFYSDYSTGDNQFICYGEYEYQPYDGVAGHNIYGEDVFHVERWEIMYPIQRDFFIGVFIPKNYICRYDMYYSKGYTFGEMLKGLYIWNYKSLPYREK